MERPRALPIGRSALSRIGGRRRTANIFGANFFRKGLLALREGLARARPRVRARPSACVPSAVIIDRRHYRWTNV